MKLGLCCMLAGTGRLATFQQPPSQHHNGSQSGVPQESMREGSRGSLVPNVLQQHHNHFNPFIHISYVGYTKIADIQAHSASPCATLRASAFFPFVRKNIYNVWKLLNKLNLYINLSSGGWGPWHKTYSEWGLRPNTNQCGGP